MVLKPLLRTDFKTCGDPAGFRPWETCPGVLKPLLRRQLVRSPDICSSCSCCRLSRARWFSPTGRIIPLIRTNPAENWSAADYRQTYRWVNVSLALEFRSLERIANAGNSQAGGLRARVSCIFKSTFGVEGGRGVQQVFGATGKNTEWVAEVVRVR